MDEKIKASIDVLDQYEEGYVRLKLNEYYSIIVATNYTANVIDSLFNHISEED